MANVKDEGLVSLEEGHFEVAEGEPDVRGWDVMTADQRRIGEVDDLLADPQALKVRYLTIDLDKDFVASNIPERTVRVPISRARLHETEKKVVLDVTAENINDFDSPMDAAPNIEDFESRRRHEPRDDEVKLTRAAEELRVGKRAVEAGEVEVSKRVESRRVTEPVTLREEEVEIERRPVTGSALADVQITADEIRIPVTREEAVIEKQAVVKEEIVIRKHQTETRETVEADLREERVDIERHGDVRAREKNTSGR